MNQIWLKQRGNGKYVKYQSQFWPIFYLRGGNSALNWLGQAYFNQNKGGQWPYYFFKP